MAVNFPTSLDTLTNPTATDYLNSPSHAGQHANANDILEALEAKVGINSSAVTTSHDYKLSGVTGTDKAASLAGSETLTNKVLTNPTINDGQIKADVSSPQGFGNNYQITRTVASNNLTVALKGIDGNDPSASNPLHFRIGNTVLALITARSFTKNAGTNWCNLGSSELKTQDTDVFLYAINETGGSAGLKFGFSRIPFAQTMNDFINTNTSEKYIAGDWTNFNATDQVEVIGRFNVANSGTASYNWSIPAADIIISRPIFETRFLMWLPTITGFTSSPASLYNCRYKLAYAELMCFINGQSSTSNATGFTLTVPFTAKNISTPGFMYWISAAIVQDNSVTLGGAGRIYATYNSAVLTVNKDMGGAAFTASGAKNVQIPLLTIEI